MSAEGQGWGQGTGWQCGGRGTAQEGDRGWGGDETALCADGAVVAIQN